MLRAAGARVDRRRLRATVWAKYPLLLQRCLATATGVSVAAAVLLFPSSPVLPFGRIWFGLTMAVLAIEAVFEVFKRE